MTDKPSVPVDTPKQQNRGDGPMSFARRLGQIVGRALVKVGISSARKWVDEKAPDLPGILDSSPGKAIPITKGGGQ